MDHIGLVFIHSDRGGASYFLFAVWQAVQSEEDDPIRQYMQELSFSEEKKLTGLKFLSKEKPQEESEYKELIEAYRYCRRLYPTFKGGKPLHEFVELMQTFGDQIRAYGRVAPATTDTPSPQNMSKLPEAIRRIIRAHRKCENKQRFLIDAFRNPYEVEYFRRRYSEFYLICIMRDVKERRNALKSFPPDALDKLESREKGNLIGKKTQENIHEWVTSQNIEECAQKADFFIENIQDPARTHPHLRYHLIRFLALSAKPGCVPPTDDERSMQIAMTARQMSGCISRQVGAVVVGSSGYVLGVGWNDPPEGQVPCSLRTGRELTDNADEKTFSLFERSEPFCQHIAKHKNGDQPFCFKSELPHVLGKPNQKMPEYTRALHAEENAFLQVAKNGGTSVVGSTLYTTASTCTLCAKNAYQLGIKRIVYVEEYPGLAIDQTLRIGELEIELDPFEGATGSAYFRLFSSLMPEKDLLEVYSYPAQYD